MSVSVFLLQELDCYESLKDSLNWPVFVFVCSPVGRMAMQFVAAQMMSAVWNGPSSSQVMKPPVSMN